MFAPLVALALGLAPAAHAHSGPEAPVVGAGELRVVRDDLAPTRTCPLENTEVEADLTGPVADVLVRQIFHNPGEEKIEAVYVFPLPHSSAVSDLTITVGDRTITSEVKPRDEARAAYQNARDDGKVAALLEQERPNIFTQSVANIEPGAKVIVEIRYVQMLDYDEGDYEFVFPMVVGPRFMPGNPVGVQGSGWSPDTTEVPDASRISPAPAKPGTRAGHDISLAVNIHSGDQEIIEIDSELHETDVKRPGRGHAVVRLAGGKEIPNRDFILRYRTAGSAVGDALFLHSDERGDFFTLLLEPPHRITPDQAVAKELIFVIDTSGSMGGPPLAKAKQAMRLAIESMNPDDTFNLLSFSNGVEGCFQAPAENTKTNRAIALEYLASLHARGGTHMMSAIDAALGGTDDPERLRIVGFMTDGYVGNDMAIIERVRNHAGTARFFSFGVGNSVNRFLLDGLAHAGRGEAEFVTLGTEADEAVERFVERIGAPVLANIELDFGDLDVREIYPRNYPDLFSHEPVMIHGRLGKKSRGEIVLRGDTGAGAFERRLEIAPRESSRGHEALPKLWARSAVKEITMQHYGDLRSGRLPDEQREQITALGVDYRIATPFTSFVAIDDSRTTEGGEPVLTPVPVEMPSGVDYEGVFGGGQGRGIAAAGSRAYSSMAGAAVRGAPTSGVAGYSGALTKQAMRTSDHAATAMLTESSHVQVQGGSAYEAAIAPQRHVAVAPREKLDEPLRKLAERVLRDGKDGTLKIGDLAVTDYRVTVIVHVTSTSSATIAELEKLGLVTSAVSGPMARVTGTIDVRKLDELAKLAQVARVEPGSA